jgi:hypothetical protein
MLVSEKENCFLTMTQPGYDKTKRFRAVSPFYAPPDGPQGDNLFHPLI